MTNHHDKLIELESNWQKLVAKELKTDQPSLKKTIGLGLSAPILSNQADPASIKQFATAALSLTLTRAEDFGWDRFNQELELGVYDFILDPFLLGWSSEECRSFVRTHLVQAQAFKGRIWGLGELSGLGTKVIHAQALTAWGAHGIHELGFLLHQFIRWAQDEKKEPRVGIAVEMETDFFKSIAKKRALSLMLESVLESLDKKELLGDIKIIGRAPWRSFTAFDYHSNILRNATSLSAAYLSGCDVVESLPFDLLVRLDETERLQARRLGLTSQLVLQNESKLSEIKDPAFGSFTIENLTELYISEAWAFMQSLEAQPLDENKMRELAQKNWQEITTQFNKRRLVQAGVNDFALPKAQVSLHSRWERSDHVRLGRSFEELRLKLKKKIEVRMAIVGTYASLQARANFTKNYFELLGLKVTEKVFFSPEEAKVWMSQSALSAWVTSDDQHNKCSNVSKRTYLAGKTQLEGCVNIYSGQDILSELSELVGWIEMGSEA